MFVFLFNVWLFSLPLSEGHLLISCISHLVSCTSHFICMDKNILFTINLQFRIVSYSGIGWYPYFPFPFTFITTPFTKINNNSTTPNPIPNLLIIPKAQYYGTVLVEVHRVLMERWRCDGVGGVVVAVVWWCWVRCGGGEGSRCWGGCWSLGREGLLLM